MSARQKKGSGGGNAPTPTAEASETLLRLASQMAHDAETLSRWARRLLTEPDQAGRILASMRMYADDPGRCLPDAVADLVPVVDRALPEGKRRLNAKARTFAKAEKAARKRCENWDEAHAEARRIVNGENVYSFGDGGDE